MTRIIFIAILLLTSCNSIYVKQNTLPPHSLIYVERGGEHIQHEIKHVLEQRGHTVTVGHKKSTAGSTYVTPLNTNSVISDNDLERVRYIVTINESGNVFRPIWCALNGFWWWRFNVSISDNVTGQEILAWRGRGCANSTISMLNKTLNKLETTNEQRNQIHHRYN